MALGERPMVINLQEASCDGNQWIAVEKYLKRIGYKAYHTGGTIASKPTSGAWRRGIITIIQENLKTRWLGEHSWDAGQFHAVEIQGILNLNSYVRPVAENILQHHTFLRACHVNCLLGLGWLQDCFAQCKRCKKCVFLRACHVHCHAGLGWGGMGCVNIRCT